MHVRASGCERPDNKSAHALVLPLVIPAAPGRDQKQMQTRNSCGSPCPVTQVSPFDQLSLCSVHFSLCSVHFTSRPQRNQRNKAGPCWCAWRLSGPKVTVKDGTPHVEVLNPRATGKCFTACSVPTLWEHEEFIFRKDQYLRTSRRIQVNNFSTIWSCDKLL